MSTLTIVEFEEYLLAKKLATNQGYTELTDARIKKICATFKFIKSTFSRECERAAWFKKEIKGYQLFLIIVKSGPGDLTKGFIRFFVVHTKKVITKLVEIANREEISEESTKETIKKYETPFVNIPHCPQCGNVMQIVNNNIHLCKNIHNHNNNKMVAHQFNSSRFKTIPFSEKTGKGEYYQKRQSRLTVN